MGERISVIRSGKRGLMNMGDSAIRRVGLALLTSILVVLTGGSCCEGSDAGITRLQISPNGSAIAYADIASRDTVYERFESHDGGLTWSAVTGNATVVDAAISVETGRGTYEIDGTNIYRTLYGGTTYRVKEVVYSSAHLQESSNVWMQEEAVRAVSCSLNLSMEPQSITYDAVSGNLIVAMGILGVVVGLPDGTWVEVAVGPYSPVDFSITSKFEELFFNGYLFYALVASLGLVSVALVIAACRRHEILVVVVLGVGWCAGLGFLTFYWFLGALVQLVVFIFLAILVAGPLVANLFLSPGSIVRKSLALACGILAFAIPGVWVTVNPVLGEFDLFSLSTLFALIISLWLVIAAFLLSRTSIRSAGMVATSVVAMCLLVTSACALWLLGFVGPNWLWLLCILSFVIPPSFLQHYLRRKRWMDFASTA